MPLGPLDWTGGPFLQLYGILLILTVIAGFAIPRWLRPDGDARRVTNADDLAYLAGGAPRVIDSIIVRALAAGSLLMPKRDRFVLERRAPLEPAARPLAALSGELTLPAIERALAPGTRDVRDRLVGAGQLIDAASGWQLRFLQTAPYLLLIVFGMTKLEIGMARDRPVGFLTLLLILTGVLALIRFVALDRRTRAGNAALAAARREHDRLRRAAQRDETAMAVALFGTAVLAGSAFADLHRLRSGDGGSSGGGDGGGDGGGGGGGCGGCGS